MFRPSSGFVDGVGAAPAKLYIFSSKRIEVRQAWPRPRTWFLGQEDGATWRGGVPELRPPLLRRSLLRTALPGVIGGMKRTARREWNSVRWWWQVPPELRAALAPFWAAHGGIWRLIVMASGPGALAPTIDLLRSNPNLALALANAGSLCGKPIRYEAVRRRLIRKQREICGFLDLPARPAMVRLFRRIPSRHVRLRGLWRLRSAIVENGGDAWLKLLAHHAPTLHQGVMELLAPDLQDFLSPGLIEDVSVSASEARRPEAAFLLRGLLGRRTAGDPRHYGASLQRVRSRYAEVFGGWDYDPPSAMPDPEVELPASPVPDASWLQRLRRVKSLRHEGRAMDHCLGEYRHAHNAVAGRAAFYHCRVDDEVATLELRLGPTGRWRLGQLRGPSNWQVSDALRARVAAHLSSYGVVTDVHASAFEAPEAFEGDWPEPHLPPPEFVATPGMDDDDWIPF